jgi:hypothetical protein
MFVAGCVGWISLNAARIVGYHWSSEERDWTGLRARFSPVGGERGDRPDRECSLPVDLDVFFAAAIGDGDHDANPD